VPKELEEAAFLDGATPLKSFLFVSLPIALPSIAVAALIAFLTGYTEFAIGWLFVDRPGMVTLAMAVSGMMQQGGVVAWSGLAALALMMSAPVVLLFVLLQRTLLNRLIIGGVEEK
ncbi:MAG: carbohydrate ABC transporter permease, partial [Chloroflexia bacterium]|nr:carbohydrate ABC transporter permease [Chloroflexia bacterium]